MEDRLNCYHMMFLVETDNDEEKYWHNYDRIIYARNMKEAKTLATDYARNYYTGEDVTVKKDKEKNTCCHFEAIGSTVTVTGLCPTTENEFMQYLLSHYAINKPSSIHTDNRQDKVEQVVESILGENVRLIKVPSDDGRDRYAIVLGTWRSDVDLPLGKSILRVIDTLL